MEAVFPGWMLASSLWSFIDVNAWRTTCRSPARMYPLEARECVVAEIPAAKRAHHDIGEIDNAGDMTVAGIAHQKTAVHLLLHPVHIGGELIGCGWRCDPWPVKGPTGERACDELALVGEFRGTKDDAGRHVKRLVGWLVARATGSRSASAATSPHDGGRRVESRRNARWQCRGVPSRSGSGEVRGSTVLHSAEETQVTNPRMVGAVDQYPLPHSVDRTTPGATPPISSASGGQVPTQ